MNKFWKIFFTIFLTIGIIATYFCFFQLLRGLSLQDDELIFIYGFTLMGIASTLWLLHYMVRLLFAIITDKKTKKRGKEDEE